MGAQGDHDIQRLGHWGDSFEETGKQRGERSGAGVVGDDQQDPLTGKVGGGNVVGDPIANAGGG